MAYTTIDDPTIYFDTLLYTGNGSNPRTLTGLNFQPDWVWLKNRTDNNGHTLADSVRGSNKTLSSQSDGSELTDKADGHLDAFTSDGFTVGIVNDDARVNNSGSNYVAWNWKAGGSASSNSDGDITTSVSANQTAGFSIITFSGSDSDATIGHGLGVKPNLFIVKSRGSSNAWIVGGDKIGSDNNGTLFLAHTDAASSGDNNFNNTAPTSSVITLRAGSSQSNRNGFTYVCYAFAEKKGFSSIGTFKGNGSSSGPYIHLGFKPSFVLLKVTSTANDWIILDNKRDPFNVATKKLNPNLDDAESNDSGVSTDFLSNGFKIRTAGGNVNQSSATFLYMAFAESPFVNSNGVPTNAR